jgi:hypothetical protein
MELASARDCRVRPGERDRTHERAALAVLFASDRVRPAGEVQDLAAGRRLDPDVGPGLLEEAARVEAGDFS